MNDLSLQAAGVVGVTIAVIHGVLGETKVFAQARIEPARTKLLLRLVWQAGAVAWAGIGLLLAAAPYMTSLTARHGIIAVAVTSFAVGGAANGYATRGRHFGWMALAAACVLALAGW